MIIHISIGILIFSKLLIKRKSFKSRQTGKMIFSSSVLQNTLEMCLLVNVL